MANLLGVEWDTRELTTLIQRKTRGYMQDMSKGIVDELRTQSYQAATALPPIKKGGLAGRPSFAGQKKIGENAVAVGYSKTFPTPENAYKLVERAIGTPKAKLYYQLLLNKGVSTAVKYAEKEGVPVGSAERHLHNSKRRGRSRGRPGETDGIRIAKNSDRRSALKESQAQVGKLKASYAEAASLLGRKTIPAWVRRHFQRRASVDLSKIKDLWSPEASTIPHPSYGDGEDRRLVRIVLSKRENSLRKQVAFIEAKNKAAFNRN